MSLGEIEDVNEIADAGAIWSRITRAVDVHAGTLAERNFQHVGDEMGFFAVMFAKLGGRTGRVEVP